MKRLFTYSVLAWFMFSCEKDETRLILKTDISPAAITSSADELNSSINESNLGDEFEISWNETDYGVSTEVTYSVEIDAACNDFGSPVVLGSTTNSSLKLTLDELNAKLLSDLNLPQHVASDVAVRVTSRIRDGYVYTSEPVTFSVSPWSEWAKGLWIDYGDGSVAIYESGESAFDGYAYLESDKPFVFADRKACGATTYGGSDNSLASGSEQAIAVSESGYYRVKANTNELSYELTLVEFGAIGDATPGGWSTSTPLIYDVARNVWEATISLTNGALKFRANNEWTINYGPSTDALDGTLVLDDPGAISIAEAGNYIVTVDFSKTKSPYFSYMVRKVSDDVPPAQLWVPGEYQGWNPATAPTIKAINSDVFEGYVYISAPTGYKFTSAPDWDHINYGDAGTPGSLTTDGLAGSLGLGTAGVYRFRVNVAALTYTADLINTMGMVGPATAGGSDEGWNTSVPMNYDADTDVWTANIDLAQGALKFRANNEWTINYGPADSNSLEGTLIFDDPGAITIPEAGNYTVTVDFSRSQSPYKYTYRIVKN